MGSKHTESINLQLVADDKKPGYFKNSPVKSQPETPDDNYDPHLHRNVPTPTTNAETLIHILKGSLGTGILAMPQAFHNSGYVTGLVFTIIIGILCTYCLHILVKTQYILCKRHKIPMLSYPLSMKMALEEGPRPFKFFAPIAVVFIDGFLILYQLGICCVYIVFVGENMKELIGKAWDVDVKIYMLIVLVPLIALNCIRNLKLLAPFSSMANIITFIGLALILVYIFDDLPGLDTSVAFASVGTLPLYFGTVLFALEAVGVVIALENNMKTPKSFGGWFGVLNIGMFVIVVLYTIMGFLGFLKYGPLSEGSVTLNLPRGDGMAIAVQVIFTIAIFISYGLQCYVPVEIIWRSYLIKRFEDSKYKLLMEYVVRVCIVIVTFLLAIAIPRLGLFISLFGAFCLSALGLIFPAIMEICVKWPNELGPFQYILIKDILLILFGLVGLISGTYTSVRDIVRSFQ